MVGAFKVDSIQGPQSMGITLLLIIAIALEGKVILVKNVKLLALVEDYHSAS